MDLLFKYMILLVLCFGLNIGLLSNSLSNKNNSRNLPVIYIISLFLLSIIAINFSKNFLFIDKFFNYYLIICAVIFIVIVYLYDNYENLRKLFTVIISILSLFLFTVVISLSNLNNFTIFDVNSNLIIDSFLICILTSIFIVIGKKLGNSLENFNSYVLGEYMIVESIFLFILGLTYNSVKNLDYTLFNSFLILSPSYMVSSVIIILIIIIIIGIFIGDKFKLN
ncbi:hypothetical protein BGI41_03625 [Methanobrevibacter sp. 87.7]|nr:hypothetical protein BGI41_03625 [Methanobrevibacter sp. 87.7]